jgi:hypothetical protein
MQNGAYQSDEVKKKLADLLVALNRFNDADTNNVYKMLDELDLFLSGMNRQYCPQLWDEIKKVLGDQSNGA